MSNETSGQLSNFDKNKTKIVANILRYLNAVLPHDVSKVKSLSHDPSKIYDLVKELNPGNMLEQNSETRIVPEQAQEMVNTLKSLNYYYLDIKKINGKSDSVEDHLVLEILEALSNATNYKCTQYRKILESRIPSLLKNTNQEVKQFNKSNEVNLSNDYLEKIQTVIFSLQFNTTKLTLQRYSITDPTGDSLKNSEEEIYKGIKALIEKYDSKSKYLDPAQPSGLSELFYHENKIVNKLKAESKLMDFAIGSHYNKHFDCNDSMSFEEMFKYKKINSKQGEAIEGSNFKCSNVSDSHIKQDYVFNYVQDCIENGPEKEVIDKSILKGKSLINLTIKFDSPIGYGRKEEGGVLYDYDQLDRAMVVLELDKISKKYFIKTIFPILDQDKITKIY